MYFHLRCKYLFHFPLFSGCSTEFLRFPLACEEPQKRIKQISIYLTVFELQLGTFHANLTSKRNLCTYISGEPKATKMIVPNVPAASDITAYYYDSWRHIRATTTTEKNVYCIIKTRALFFCLFHILIRFTFLSPFISIPIYSAQIQRLYLVFSHTYFLLLSR